MMGNEKRQGLFRLGSVVVFTLLLMIGLTVCFDTYYDLNDDTVIKDIISGTYTGAPSGYSIQMLYPLSWGLAVLYTAIPGVAWYGLFLCLCQFGALAVIAWRLVGLTDNKKWQIVLLVVEALVGMGLLFRNFVFVQYSVTSGMCMAAAIFWYVTGEQAKDWIDALKRNMIAVILVWISFCIRTELCVMLLPFLLLAGLVKWLGEAKIFTVENVKKYLFLIATAMAGIFVLYGLDRYAYRSVQWSEFCDFFDARTDLYDFYGIPDYDENQAFYQELGMSRESYTLLQNYNFSLDEDIDAELMHKLVTYQKKQAENGQGLYSFMGLTTKKSFKEALWLYKEYLLKQSSYLILAGYLLYFLQAFARRRSGWMWKLILLFGVRSILWMYLFMVDRLPERITVPLMVAEFAVLAGWLIQEFRVLENGDTIQTQLVGRMLGMKKLGSVLILVLCGVATLLINVAQTRQEYEKRLVTNKRWEALIAYCREHPENYYTVDVYSSTSYQGAAYSEKIFVNVDNQYRNFDICGGWAAKSPLMYEKLGRAGISELESTLVAENCRTYFVAACDKDLQWLTEYYASKDQRIRIQREDTINAEGEEAFYVYRLENVD